MPADKGIQAVAYVFLALDRLADMSVHGFESQFAESIEQVFFSRDVVIKRSLVNIQSPGDFTRRGFGETLFAE